MPRNKPPPFDPTGAMEGSDFLKKVKGQFFTSDGKSKWPGEPKITQVGRAKAELPVALEKLFQAALGIPLPGPDRGANKKAFAATALGKLRKAAIASKWPTAKSKIPASWPKKDRAVYRLFEVAHAVNLMLRAFARKGGGGGPRTFPPPVKP
jgi:hypothetical protein